MNQNEEQELAEEQTAETTDQPSSVQHAAESSSPSEEEKALTEREEKDIEGASTAQQALEHVAQTPEDPVAKANREYNALTPGFPYHWPPRKGHPEDLRAVAAYQDNTPKRSSQKQPEPPSQGAANDAAPGRGLPGGAAAVDVAVTGGK